MFSLSCLSWGLAGSCPKPGLGAAGAWLDLTGMGLGGVLAPSAIGAGSGQTCSLATKGGVESALLARAVYIPVITSEKQAQGSRQHILE